MKITKKPTKGRMLMICAIAALIVIFACGVFLGPTNGPVWLHVLAMDVDETRGAISYYETEYGTMPTVTSNAQLIKVLTGDNPRKIEFIDLKPIQLNADGEMIDPWGTPFRFSNRCRREISLQVSRSRQNFRHRR